MTPSLTDLIELHEYLTATCDELITYATDAAYDDDIRLTDINIARSISADQTESACFTNLPLFTNLDHFLDTFLLDALITTHLCTRLNCTPLDISADY